MAFNNNVVRAFTKADVERINPGQLGVYGIIGRRGQWLYVGSGDIRARMLAHVNRDNPRLMLSGPTSWVAEVTPDYITREKQLILELQPSCNQRVG